MSSLFYFLTHFLMKTKVFFILTLLCFISILANDLIGQSNLSIVPPLTPRDSIYYQTPVINFTKYNGTHTNPRPTILSDTLGVIRANMNAGSGLIQEGAKIIFRLDSVPGAAWQNQIEFYTGILANQKTMTMKANGSVGIGTDVPEKRLDVNGPIKVGPDTSAPVEGVLHFSNGDFEGYANGSWHSFTNQSPWVEDTNGISYSNGLVGIGTTTPEQTLDVNGGIKVGMTTDSIEGTLRYSGTGFEGFTGGEWVDLGVQSPWEVQDSLITLDSSYSLMVGATDNDNSVLKSLFATSKVIFSTQDSTTGKIDSGLLGIGKEAGLVGLSSEGVGMVGISTIGHAVQGIVIGSGVAIYGSTTGLFGTADTNSYAGYFEGRVYCDSKLMVQNQVEIGDSTIQSGSHTDYRLAVDGKIVTKELVCTLSDWADYVFEDNYELQSLEEVEKYIKKEHHLPNIPSRKEITTQGLEVGEIIRLQQEKIEELYLHLIELNKQVEKLEGQTYSPNNK